MCLFKVSFNNSGYSLIQTNIKQFHGLQEAFRLLQKRTREFVCMRPGLNQIFNYLVFLTVLMFFLNLVKMTVKTMRSY